MKEAKIWGTRALKQTYRKEFNHSSGEYERVANPKRVTATVEFECDVSEAGFFEDKKVFLYTEEENTAMQNPDKQDIMENKRFAKMLFNKCLEEVE